jgi:hypothetical protein
MGNVKLIVIYLCPKDLESFERAYRTEHVPMAVESSAARQNLWRAK